MLGIQNALTINIILVGNSSKNILNHLNHEN